MPFTGDYVLSRLSRGIYIAHPNVDDPLAYTRPNGERIELLGMILTTDLGTTPRVTWCFPGFAPNDMERPAIIHDLLFERRHAGDETYTLKEVNQILYESLIDEGYPMWKARLIRWCCNVFGKRSWEHGFLPNVQRFRRDMLLMLKGDK
jgi:hypothetical protein